MKRKMVVTLGLAGMIAVVFGVSRLALPSRNDSEWKLSEMKPGSVEKESIEEEIPFYEVTIEGLRGREYESEVTLGNVYQKTGSYTSYLASYESDGLKINGLLTRPAGEEPEGGWPGVVFVHGYIPPNTYRTTEKYVDYVNYLARSGFVVFKIDLRGHGESEGEATGAYYSEGYVVDVLSAYNALGKLSWVNPGRIGLWGHSMAGNLVMRSMAVRPSIPAGVIWAGAVYSYTDLVELGLNDNSFDRNRGTSGRIFSRSRELFDVVGRPEEGGEFWSLVSPLNYLSDLTGAVQLHHAVGDPVVSVEYARGLVEELEKAGVKHEFYEYSGSDHNLGSPAFGSAMQRTVEFYHGNLN